MSYKALYRIYRPKDFNEVAGQTHITTTLKNALANDKVAHAYLFSGPRGTGKTSIAKIFAKAVNCTKAPIDNPCNECDNCKGIQEGAISDIIEIDAASNNGVDEIREIRDKVKYLPGYVKYKVYIIDEVHMLSTGAFNALLKTLEEPPAHVIFILCTTEPQKIPLTIHSRCQRFDFKAITTKEIIGKLKEIIDSEQINIDQNAINQIALYAEGGLRDAISLLDQVRSYSPEHITENDVNQISGAVSTETQLKLAESLIKSDSTVAIDYLNSLITEGKEVKKITYNLIEFFRDILMVKNLRRLDENNTLYKNDDFIKITETISNRRTFQIIDILNKVYNEIKWSNDPKIHLELAFIKITDQEVDSESKLISIIDDLESRIIKLENNPTPTFTQTAPPMSKKETEDIVEEENLTIEEEESEDIPLVEEDNTIEMTEEESIEEFNLFDSIEDEPEPQEKQEPEILKKDDKPIDVIVSSDLNDTYPIEYIEDVLNNGDKDDKRHLIESWNRLRRSATTEEEKHIAQILEAGSVAASNKKRIIILFPSPSICNKLMTPSNKNIVKSVLRNTYLRDIDFMALPEDIFKKVSGEFVALWREGHRDIKLSKIKSEGLKNVADVKQETTEDSQPQVIKDAVELFGDIVTIKK